MTSLAPAAHTESPVLELPLLKTIVIADDFAPFRRLIRSKLRTNGFQIVAEASDGIEAVSKTAELQPDVVLLDITMPRLNGLQAAAQIRSVAPASRILFVSQNGDPDIVQSAMSHGAAGFLNKSQIGSELLHAIQTALEGKTFVSAVLQRL